MDFNNPMTIVNICAVIGWLGFIGLIIWTYRRRDWAAVALNIGGFLWTIATYIINFKLGGL